MEKNLKKIWKFWNELEIGKKFGNLEKIFGNWGKILNKEKLGNLEFGNW